jgi:2-polyprenyl-3-methyl-5-hydroxy-6-metoxy-1,4-benzoquinol methylase
LVGVGDRNDGALVSESRSALGPDESAAHGRDTRHAVAPGGHKAWRWPQPNVKHSIFWFGVQCRRKVQVLTSLLQRVVTAWTGSERGSLDVDALWRDGDYFWTAVGERPDEVRRALAERYALVPSSYVNRYFSHLLSEHRLNPLAPLYIESELGAPARQLALLRELESCGFPVAGKRCLDIGCSNGSLLLAALGKGASECVGVDVSEPRLSSARQLCDGSGIELLLADLASDDLSTLRPFDLVFCTDVLEHVTSIPGIVSAMGRHLAAGSDARIFVTLFNYLSTASVLSEPHYAIPGMVLVERDIAAEIWHAVRAQLNSSLEYEVERWPTYVELQRIAGDAGLRAEPFVDRAGVLANRAGFWQGYVGRLDELERSAGSRLDTLPLSSAHRAVLRDAIRSYRAEADAQHRAFEAALPHASDDDVIAFFMRYYAQPIRATLGRV